MSVHTGLPATRRSEDAAPRRELVGAWVSALITVGATVAIFFVSETAETALWFVVPIMFVAAVGAVWLGLAARRHGDGRGAFPALIGGLVGGFYVLMAALALVGHLFGFE